MRYCPTCGARFTQEAAFCPHDGIATEELPEGSAGEAEDPLLGQVIDGRYRIDALLGQGGMGVVYTATHTALDKRLAVKVLRAEMARDEGVVQRFMQEAQAASSIGHANIIDISDFGHLDDGSVYFVMEYLDGEPLTELIARGGSLPLQEAIQIVQQIASAVGAAHARGIVHRDLKPDNIFLVERDEDPRFVKVLDFGIAKVGGAANKLTKTGVIFGTPHYMSPEQAAGQGIDHRTDIYALGVIMYEMFTGDVPFDAETFMGILSKHMFEEPLRPTVASTERDLGALEEVIIKALAKKTAERYQSMDELVADLKRVQRVGRVTIGAGAATVREAPRVAPPDDVAGALEAPSRTERRPSETVPGLPKRRAPLVLAAVAAVAVLGGGIAIAAIALGSGEEASANAEAAAAAAEPEPGAEQGEQGAGDAADEATEDAGGTEQAERATIRLQSEPAGAQVMVEGAVIANTPAELPRPEQGRTRTVTLRAPGYEDQEVVLGETSPQTMSVTLDEEPERAPSRRLRRARRQPRAPAKTDTDTRTQERPSETEEPDKPDFGRAGLGGEVVDPWAD